MPRKLKVNISKEWLLNKYINERMSISSISKELNVLPETVSKYLDMFNIEKRKNSSHRYSFNELFFSEPGTLNSYWAGFIAADGCILEKKVNNLLQVELGYKDIEHLKKFKEDISFNGNIYRVKRTCNCYKEQKYSCKICISSQKICDDLANNYNITPRKTKTIKPPIHLNNINALAFICGLIDGDGCITLNTNNVTIRCCGTLELVEWAANKINELINTDDNIIIQKQPGCYIFVVSKSKNILILYKQIKTINIPLLRRKWDLVEKYNTDIKYSKRNKLIIEFGGKIQPLWYWAEELNMSYPALYARIFVSKWSIEKSFMTPIKEIPHAFRSSR